jgi:hypothetical protein
MHHHTCTITPCTIAPITITPCNVIRTPRPPSFSAHTSVYGDEVRTSLAPMHHHTCTITPCTITPITITPCNAIRTPRPPSFSAHTSVYGDEVRTSLAPLHHHTCTITPYHHTNNHHTMQRHTHTPTAIVFGSYLCLRRRGFSHASRTRAYAPSYACLNRRRVTLSLHAGATACVCVQVVQVTISCVPCSRPAGLDVHLHCVDLRRELHHRMGLVRRSRQLQPLAFRDQSCTS